MALSTGLPINGDLSDSKNEEADETRFSKDKSRRKEHQFFIRYLLVSDFIVTSKVVESLDHIRNKIKYMIKRLRT
jgi:hypothetical protein